MVCKNCGADLKPGIKYCLNCGYYIDEAGAEKGRNSNLDSDDSANYDDFSTPSALDYDSESDGSYEYSEEFDTRKKHKSMTVTDIVIYVILALIIVVSIVVIIINPGKKTTVVNKQVGNETVVEPSVIEMDGYTVTLPGNLYYGVSEDKLYVSDKENYFFFMFVQNWEYEKYSEDTELFTKVLEKQELKVLSTEKRTVNGVEVIIYNVQGPDQTMYVYLTKVNDSNMAIGTITSVENGDWGKALDVIVDLCASLDFNGSIFTDNTDEGEDNTVDTSVDGIGKILKKSIGSSKDIKLSKAKKKKRSK